MNLPARLRGARFGLRALTQKKGGDVALLCGEHEPAAGNEIENLWIASDLHDHGTETGTGHSIDARTQGIGRIGRAQQKKSRRIDSQFCKPGWCKCAMFERGEILDDPEHPLHPAHALCGTGSKARRGRVTGEDLMQCAAREPAVQNRIGVRMAERTTRETPAFAQNRVEELACFFQFLGYFGHQMFTICSSMQKHTEQSQSVHQAIAYIAISGPYATRRGSRRPPGILRRSTSPSEARSGRTPPNGIARRTDARSCHWRRSPS